MMKALPLFHRLEGVPILLVGEGEGADAKARLIEEAGGIVVRTEGEGARLAFVAMDDEAEAATTSSSLRAQGLLVNVVDRPEMSDFLVPAIVDRSPVIVAISTAGASASLAKALKERLDVLLPPTLGAMAAAISSAKANIAASLPTVAQRREFWARLMAPGAPLDPVAPPADPQAAILSALAEGGDVPPRLDEIHLGPEGAEGLTLKQMRLMAQADLVIHEPGVPSEVLSLIRRDAARQLGTEAPAELSGRIVVLRAEV